MEAIELVGEGRTAKTSLDVAALSATLETYRPRLMAVARSLIGYHADSEDIVQATYEHALRHISELRTESALWSWLVVIETRETFRWRRRLARTMTAANFQAQAAEDDPSQTVALRDALNHLPRRVRTATVLHYMADLTVREVSVAMGVSENTVKTQLRDGLRLLREALS